MRCFDDENIVHVAGKVDPIDDINVINTELALADLATVEKALNRYAKQARSGGDKEALKLVLVLEKIQPVLNEGKAVRTVKLSPRRVGRHPSALPPHRQARHVRGERRRSRL